MSESASLDSLPPLRDVIAQYDLRAKKSLGQNFLLDSNITDKIVRLIPDLRGYSVFEIGPGPGGLTRSLLRSEAQSVFAVEFDDKAVTALQDLKACSNGRLEVLHADALLVNLMEKAPAPRAIMANLPYNIATPLLLKWLGQIYADPSAYDFMALMFQREVADRITAQVGTKAYGRLAVMCQWLCGVSRAYDLPPSAFTPPPKVHSSVVRFHTKAVNPGDARPRFKTMEALLEKAFQQRRKMIRSSLKVHIEAIDACGLDSTLRAENLTLDDYVRLALQIEGAEPEAS